MPVEVSIMGVSRLSGRALRLEGGTLASVAARLVGEVGAKFPGMEDVQAFLNGQVVEESWDRVEVEDGDRVLLIVPMGGG